MKTGSKSVKLEGPSHTNWGVQKPLSKCYALRHGMLYPYE